MKLGKRWVMANVLDCDIVIVFIGNPFEMRLLNLRINFYLLRTFCPHLGIFFFFVFFFLRNKKKKKSKKNPYQDEDKKSAINKSLFCDIVVSKFELKSRNHIHFRTKNLEKVMRPLISPVMG